jgi:hypothetical protein
VLSATAKRRIRTRTRAQARKRMTAFVSRCVPFTRKAADWCQGAMRGSIKGRCIPRPCGASWSRFGALIREGPLKRLERGPRAYRDGNQNEPSHPRLDPAYPRHGCAAGELLECVGSGRVEGIGARVAQYLDEAMKCRQCLRARQRVVHRIFEADCEGCTIRRIAYLPADDRERWFDRVQHLGGIGDRAEAVKLVNLERARIAALSAAMPRKESVK